MAKRVEPKRFTLRERDKALLRLATLLLRSENYRLGVSSDAIVMFDVDFTRSRICRAWWRLIAEWLANVYRAPVAVLRTERGRHLILLRELPNKRVELARLRARLKRLEEEVEETWGLINSWKVELRYPARREEAYERIGELFAKLNELKAKLRETKRELRRIEEWMLPVQFWDNAYEYAMDCIRRRRRGEKLLYPHEWAMAVCLDDQHVELTLKRKYTTLRISAKPCKNPDIEFLRIIEPEKK
ncbi:MAG: hypothetical protein DRO39_01965 [Thermoprotei archaeon]|nr:MAG: hypothetical protein DRO39_01965 [Thermoprotei archaeon]